MRADMRVSIPVVEGGVALNHQIITVHFAIIEGYTGPYITRTQGGGLDSLSMIAGLMQEGTQMP